MKHNHLEGLHTIITKNAESQAVFVFVRGVLAAKPETSIGEAVRMFISEFGCDSLDPKSVQRRYYRMLPEYMRNNHLFKHSKHDSSISPGNGKAGKFFAPGMGVTPGK